MVFGVPSYATLYDVTDAFYTHYSYPGDHPNGYEAYKASNNVTGVTNAWHSYGSGTPAWIAISLPEAEIVSQLRVNSGASWASAVGALKNFTFRPIKINTVLPVFWPEI